MSENGEILDSLNINALMNTPNARKRVEYQTYLTLMSKPIKDLKLPNKMRQLLGYFISTGRRLLVN